MSFFDSCNLFWFNDLPCISIAASTLLVTISMDYFFSCPSTFNLFVSLDLKWVSSSPDLVAWLVGVSSCVPKDCGFNLWSGHIPRLQIQSLVGVYMEGKQSMFLSYIDVSPHPLKINKHIRGWGFTNTNK